MHISCFLWLHSSRLVYVPVNRCNSLMVLVQCGHQNRGQQTCQARPEGRPGSGSCCLPMGSWETPTKSSMSAQLLS